MISPQMQAWLDQEDARVSTNIRKFGWTIEYVGGGCSRPGCDCEAGSGPPFAYTIGLFGLGHPELVIVGVPPTTALKVLNQLGGRIREGEDLVPGQLLTVKDWPHRIVPEELPNPGSILLGSNRHYQRPPEISAPALQLSYDDRQGRFPWEAGYATPEMQPRPGTFSA